MRDDESLRRAINEPIRIVPYDLRWREEFEKEKARLLALDSNTLWGIEHIGSTAVPGMGAKPIIDLMAGVSSMIKADALLPGLCRIGYTTSEEFNGTLGDRRWLMRHVEGRRTHHLHLMIFGGEEWEKRIRFRDRLRVDAELRVEYQMLKARLAKAGGSDRELYTAAKTEFIEKALRGRNR